MKKKIVKREDLVLRNGQICIYFLGILNKIFCKKCFCYFLIDFSKRAKSRDIEKKAKKRCY